MSDQHVTEAENTRINSAPKSLGQVGYEAMLARVKAYAEMSGHNWIGGPSDLWENQPARFRDDWDLVATSIEIAVKEKIVKEVAEQMTPKWIDRPGNASMLHEANAERAAKLDFKYADLSAFKPSPEYESALNKAMDQFHAWRCPKCGGLGRWDWKARHEALSLDDSPYTMTIVCNANCEQMGAKL